MPTKKVEKGITRFDIHERGTHGYMARISRNKEKLNKFFSDKDHGGKRKALVAARKCYEKWVKTLPPPTTSKDIMSARNKSGRVGVHLAENPSEVWEDVVYTAYVATWMGESGTREKLSFSTKKYGKKKAFELACVAREHEISDRDKIESIFEKQGSKGSKKKASKKSKKKTTKKKARKSRR